MTTFDISIVSDTICPWCYIGSRRLQKAILLYQKTYPGGSKDTFNMEWKPYFLNADGPKEGVLIQDKMVGRMGEERTDKAQKHMMRLGANEGIAINYGGKTGNTQLSHQLLHFAKSKGLEMQNAVAEELFRLHFGEERDITDIQTMLDAAANMGLDTEEVRTYLLNGSGIEEVAREAAELRASGVQGVPKFIFEGGKHSVDGSGDAMEFFEILMKIKGDPNFQ